MTGDAVKHARAIEVELEQYLKVHKKSYQDLGFIFSFLMLKLGMLQRAVVDLEVKMLAVKGILTLSNEGGVSEKAIKEVLDQHSMTGTDMTAAKKELLKEYGIEVTDADS